MRAQTWSCHPNEAPDSLANHILMQLLQQVQLTTDRIAVSYMTDIYVYHFISVNVKPLKIHWNVSALDLDAVIMVMVDRHLRQCLL